MARIKNASFAGAVPRSVVADASIRKDWLANVAGDVAKVSDLATGENSETPITHTGSGDGCPLRLPLAAQHLDRSLTIYGTTIVEDDFYILAVPVFVRPGEAGQYRLTVNVSPFGSDVVTAEVLSSSGTVDWGPYPGRRETTNDVIVASEAAAIGSGSRLGDAVTWSITLGEGIQYVLVKRPCYFADADPAGTLYSWTLDHDRTYSGESNGLTAGNGGTAISDPYAAHTTFTPSTDHDTYDEEVAINGPLSAYVLTRINRQLNTLWEYITGAVIPGNATHKCSTTWDNNRASFTAEGLLDFPLQVVALGGCIGTTGKPAVGDYTDSTPSDGLIGWNTHPLTRSTTNDIVASVVMTLPSFRTSSSDLDCVVLVHSPGGAGTAGNWRFRVNNVTTSSASSAVALVQVGTSNFLVATITGIPFSASADNVLDIQIANTASGALGTETLDILGACFFFDP
jgi:hypothetical protein